MQLLPQIFKKKQTVANVRRKNRIIRRPAFSNVSLREKTYAPSSDYWYNPVGLETVAGIQVDEITALSYLTVWACVTLIAGDVARLPLMLIKRNPDGSKDRITDNSAYQLCHNNPNDEMSSRTWIETGMGHVLLWGNHYSLKIRNAMGQVVEIWPIDNPGAVEVYRSKETKRLRYRWNIQGKSAPVEFAAEDIIHIKGFGLNGIMGLNPVEIASDTIALGIALNQFASQYFAKGLHPTGLISLPPEVAGRMGDKKQRDDYRNFIMSQYAGIGKSHSLMILADGETYSSFGRNMDESQGVESREFQKKEICGFYRVPAHKVQIHGSNSNYNNMEQENQSYVDSCLIHWISRWEKALTYQLLTQKDRDNGLSFEFIMDGLLRGDAKVRSEFYGKMLDHGAFTRNEVRKLENLNPLPENQYGDETMLPLNYVFAKDALSIGADMTGNNQLPDIAQASLIKRVMNPQAEKRSITLRDRIAKQYIPLIRDAAQAVINRESKAIIFQVDKLKRNRNEGDLRKFLDEFYKSMPEYIRVKLGPVLRSYLEAVYNTSADEINIDPTDPELIKFIDEYVAAYIQRHNNESFMQMSALLIENDLDAITERAQEWQEGRADDIAQSESVRASNAIYQAVAFSAGMGTVWRIRGKSTCAHCRSLEGKVVRSGQSFALDGDVLKVEENGKWISMKMRGTKKHPPLHAGRRGICDCYLFIGI